MWIYSNFRNTSYTSVAMDKEMVEWEIDSLYTTDNPEVVNRSKWVVCSIGKPLLTNWVWASVFSLEEMLKYWLALCALMIYWEPEMSAGDYGQVT